MTRLKRQLSRCPKIALPASIKPLSKKDAKWLQANKSARKIINIEHGKSVEEFNSRYYYQQLDGCRPDKLKRKSLNIANCTKILMTRPMLRYRAHGGRNEDVESGIAYIHKAMLRYDIGMTTVPFHITETSEPGGRGQWKNCTGIPGMREILRDCRPLRTHV